MRRPLATVGLFFIFLILIFQLIIPHHYPDFSSLDKQSIRLCGQLIRREYKQKDNVMQEILYVDIQNILSGENLSEGTYPDLKGLQIVCYVNSSNPIPLDEKLPPLGSEVILTGKLSSFAETRVPGMFDARKYYETIGISAALHNAELSEYIAPSSLYWKLTNKLSYIRSTCGMLSDLCFTESDSGVVRTMLLGDKSYLDADLKTIYSSCGLAHILAISGLHISLLGMSFYTILRKMRLHAVISAIFSIILMILYGLMIGFGASTIRAIVMFSIRMLAGVLHRTYDATTAVVIAAILILIGQPMYIFYSGFQFSFGAIMAIFFISPILESIIPSRILANTSINIVTLPIQLNSYYYFPLISIPLNIILIPLMAVLLICMLITLAVGAVFIPLGKLLGISVHIILLFVRLACELSMKLPITHMITGKPTALQIFLYITLLLITLIFEKHQTSFQLLLHIVACSVILTLHISFGTDVTLLDIGQGDCIYITDNAGTDIMIDGGSSDISGVGEYRITPFLLSRGVSCLDAVFITHLDEDHYNGILELINNTDSLTPSISALYLTEATIASNGPDYEALVHAAARANIPIKKVSQGDTFRSARFTLECLYPGPSYSDESTNSQSLVMLLTTPNAKMLFTGDIEGDGERAITDILSNSIQNKNQYTTILKLAHHGSKNSTSDEFLDIFSPDIGLISSGQNNRYGHPHAQTISRLANHSVSYYNTAELGTLKIHIGQNNSSLRSYLLNPW